MCRRLRGLCSGLIFIEGPRAPQVGAKANIALMKLNYGRKKGGQKKTQRERMHDGGENADVGYGFVRNVGSH